MNIPIQLIPIFSVVALMFASAVNLFCGANSTDTQLKSVETAKVSAGKRDQSPQNDLQRKIIEGAKRNLEENTEYDLTMGYYVLTFEDGVNTGRKVFPRGDLDPAIGVCTDVIVRSLRHAGIVDLQEAVNEDLKANSNEYPLSRWGKKKADTNIDHRRVMNLEVWFARHWTVIEEDTFLPGDIVVWDMNQDGASDHTGIVSDNVTSGRNTVIHNHPDPGHIADEDKLFKWKITGHFRVPAPSE